MGSLGLLPEKFFRATPSRKRLLENGIKATSQLISVPRAKTYPLTRKRNTKKLRRLLLLLSYRPKLETRSHAIAPKER